MELSKLFGLPAHPLLVHVPVVLIPLAAVGAVVIAVSPKLRERFGWVVAGIAVVGGLGALLAASAGESLEETLRNNGEEISSNLSHHAELGDAAKVFGVVFAVIVVAFVAIDHWLRRQSRSGQADAPRSTALRKWGLPIAAAATVVTGALATAWIVQAGHTGAKSTWEDVSEGG